MSSESALDLLERFAEIEWLVAKIYFRFSHLFLDRPELRDFWWDMAHEEEQHGSILSACRTLIGKDKLERLELDVTREKAEELKRWLRSYLSRGTPSLGVDEAFRIALEIEGSEVNTIYNKLLHAAGLGGAQIVESLGIPVHVQTQKLKVAIHRFCADPGLLETAQRL
ncbi:MAG TPA: hypothetical protein VNN77_15345 [candidate division Zixibacteria bacterium]|nr:hypothetical protein [candidate division Zixibacteria bacterium]